MGQTPTRATDLLKRAEEYEQMATTATTTEVRDALLRLAARFRRLAEQVTQEADD